MSRDQQVLALRVEIAAIAAASRELLGASVPRRSTSRDDTTGITGMREPALLAVARAARRSTSRDYGDGDLSDEIVVDRRRAR